MVLDSLYDPPPAPDDAAATVAGGRHWCGCWFQRPADQWVRPSYHPRPRYLGRHLALVSTPTGDVFIMHNEGGWLPREPAWRVA